MRGAMAVPALRALAVVWVCALAAVAQLAQLAQALDCEVRFSTGTRKYTACNAFDLPDYRVKYFWNLKSDSIEIAVTANTTGWVGFAVAKEMGVMQGSEAVIGFVDRSGIANVTGYVLQRGDASAPDKSVRQSTVQHITAAFTEATQDETYLTFIRKLNVEGALPIKARGKTNVLFAVGDRNALSYHGHNKRGLSIDFSKVPAPTATVTAIPTAQPEHDCALLFNGTAYDFPACTGASLNGIQYKMFWQLSDDQSSVRIAARAETTGWVGFGIAAHASQMGGGVGVIGYVDALGAEHVHDYQLVGGSTDPGQAVHRESKQGVVDARVETRNGLTCIMFSRPVSAAAVGVPDVSLTGNTAVLWAAGTAPKLSFHYSHRRGELVNFVTGGASDALPAWTIAHGLLMGVTFALTLPVAIIIARFFRHHDPLWFRLHRGFMIFGALTVLAAGALALYYGSRTQILHLILGLTAYVFVLLNVTFALFRPHIEHRYREVWEFMHRLGGRLAVIAGMSNVYVGLHVINADSVWWAVYSSIVGAVALFALVSEIKLMAETSTFEEESKLLFPQSTIRRRRSSSSFSSQFSSPGVQAAW